MHAFFKALLFLAAGRGHPRPHDEQDMKRMGGLRRYLPITFSAFIVGYLALSAIPPFDGFWSKDDVLQAAWHKSPALWAIGVVTAGLTAYYMSRQVMLVFAGQARWAEHNAAHGAAGDGRSRPRRPGSIGAAEPTGPHEAPLVMTVPARHPGRRLRHRLADQRALRRPRLHQQVAGAGLPGHHRPAFQVSTGDQVGDRRHRHRRGVHRPDRRPAACGGASPTSRSWSRPSCGTAGTSTRAWPPRCRAAGQLANAFSFGVDHGFVDGTINGVAQLTAQTGRQLRRVQTGYVRNYALGIGIGAAIILAYVATRVGS